MFITERTQIAKLYSKIKEERADKSEQEYFDRINRQIDDPFGEDARSPFCGDEASTKEFWAEMYANDLEGYEMGAYDYDEY